MHESVGKNGIGPPQLAPARILRPGDPGFPVSQGTPGSKFQNCQHPGCGRRYMPSVPGMRYCLEHNTPEAAAGRAAGMVGTPVKQPPKERQVTKPKGKAAERVCAHEGCSMRFEPQRSDSQYCPEHAQKSWFYYRWKTKKAAEEGTTPPSPPGQAGARVRARKVKPAAPASAPNPIRESLANLKAKQQASEGRQANGQKADQDKLQADLILGDFPRALSAVIEVGQHGNATKYIPGSWLKLDNGVQRVRNAAMRHWLNARMGLVRDPQSNLLTLAHEAWNKLAELELVLRAEEDRKA